MNLVVLPMQTLPKIIGWQKSVAVTILLSLSLSTFATPSIAASKATFLGIQPSDPERTPFQNKGKYQLAQVSDNCRQVSARSGLYVRREPTVYSTALGIIASGRYVTIENGGTKNWVPISAPLKGYVFTDYLTSCQSPPPPSNCRQVSAWGGVYVRREPSINSAVLGIVANGRYVTIQNPGANGWVTISVPLRGYVSADYLTYCR